MNYALRPLAWAVAASLLLLTVFIGVWLIRSTGDEQDCLSHGGSWSHHYDSTSPTPNGWIDNHTCTVRGHS